MKLNVGYVQKYNSHKGFGFVKLILSQEGLGNEIFFHISKIKSRYPEIAKKFDADEYHDTLLWYSIEQNNKGQCVGEIWTTFKSIPDEIKKEFRKNFRAFSDTLSISNLEDDQIIKIAEEVLSKLEYQVWLYKRREKSKEKNDNYQKYNRRKAREADRVFVDYLGLPEELYEKIFKVAREFRTNSLSHIVGGSDVIVEYTDGSVFLYDWIKYPDRYIQEFFSGSVDYPESEQIALAKDKIKRIFSRIYEDKEARKNTSFEEVWNSKSANITPWDALKEFKAKKEEEKQEDFFLEDDLFDLGITPDWSANRSEFDNDWEYAEAVWGIPDPRLVEDF